jgi:hypothetical protein
MLLCTFWWDFIVYRLLMILLGIVSILIEISLINRYHPLMLQLRLHLLLQQQLLLLSQQQLLLLLKSHWRLFWLNSLYIRKLQISILWVFYKNDKSIKIEKAYMIFSVCSFVLRSTVWFWLSSVLIV